MSERAMELARRFEQISDEAIALVEGCNEAQWAMICPEEGWPIGVVAHHIAVAMPVASRWVSRVAVGRAIPTTRAMIDQLNDGHAEQSAAATRDETLTLLRTNSAQAAENVRGLNDEQLAQTAEVGPADGRELTAEQVIKFILIHHPKDHVASMRKTLGV